MDVENLDALTPAELDALLNQALNPQVPVEVLYAVLERIGAAPAHPQRPTQPQPQAHQQPRPQVSPRGAATDRAVRPERPQQPKPPRSQPPKTPTSQAPTMPGPAPAQGNRGVPGNPYASGNSGANPNPNPPSPNRNHGPNPNQNRHPDAQPTAVIPVVPSANPGTRPKANGESGR